MGLNPIQQLNAVTILGMIAVFWVTFVALKAIFFNPILDVVVARREKIAASRAKLCEADEVVQAARAEAEVILAEVDEQAEKIARETTEDAEAQRQEKVVAAKEESDRILAEGRIQVADVRKEEEEKVRHELVGCTKIACDKLVGKVDGRLVESIVDKVMRARLAT